MVDTQGPVAGWYSDPADSARIRWWDGVSWSEHTRDLAAPAQEPTAASTFGAVPAGGPGSWPVAPELPVTPVPETPSVPSFQTEAVPRSGFDPTAVAGSVLPGAATHAPAPEFGQPHAASGYGDVSAAAGPTWAGQSGVGGPAGVGYVTQGQGYAAPGGDYPTTGPGESDRAGMPGQPTTASREPVATKKSHKGLAVLLVVLGVLIVAAAAVWFFMLRNNNAAAVTGSPSKAGSRSAAPAVPTPVPCSATVTTLTTDGLTATVISRLQGTAGNQDLAAASAFFTGASQRGSAAMAATGQVCLDAARSGQAPAQYATFIEAFNKAVADGAAMAPLAAASPAGVSPQNKATLEADALALTAAQAAVVTPAPPATVAPAG